MVSINGNIDVKQIYASQAKALPSSVEKQPDVTYQGPNPSLSNVMPSTEQFLAQLQVQYCTHEEAANREQYGMPGCIGVDNPQEAAGRTNQRVNNATDAATGVLRLIPGCQHSSEGDRCFAPVQGINEIRGANQSNETLNNQ